MLEQVKEIICEYVEVDPSEIHEESRFIEDLGFTSFDFMSMVGEFEDTFDIEVREEDVVHVKTVGEAIEYVKKLQAE
ncbi:MAG TPA: acyl carrier protein [Candidatus Blautia avistercoris]|uniref:acyl carrier protein n=1 Tax=Blautia sp. An249 TaxID=1965603 RepID=UPI000B3750BF|nr:acyl carrier protein [Blautia sp. An249]OUO80576.1 acyl carrier protein [Blautia sp. An249]HIY19427.1 acyl carrier protein [Candidatus Blautia avistercoris]